MEENEIENEPEDEDDSDILPKVRLKNKISGNKLRE